jgi:chemotaxis signal transduction protein
VISRMMGLKNVQSMQPVEEKGIRPWLAGTFRDDEGRLWQELDIGALVAHEDFLHVGV